MQGSWEGYRRVLGQCIHDRNAVEAGMRFFRLCPRRRRFDMAAGGGCSGWSAGCSTSPGPPKDT